MACLHALQVRLFPPRVSGPGKLWAHWGLQTCWSMTKVWAVIHGRTYIVVVPCSMDACPSQTFAWSCLTACPRRPLWFWRVQSESSSTQLDSQATSNSSWNRWVPKTEGDHAQNQLGSRWTSDLRLCLSYILSAGPADWTQTVTQRPEATLWMIWFSTISCKQNVPDVFDQICPSKNTRCHDSLWRWQPALRSPA